MKLNSKVIRSAVLVFVVIVVIFKIYSSLMPEAQAAGNLMNASNQCHTQGFIYNYTTEICTTNGHTLATYTGAAPLSGLFSGSGIIFLIIMAALIIMIVRQLIKNKK